MLHQVFIRNWAVTTFLAQPVRTLFLAHCGWNFALDCSCSAQPSVRSSLISQADPGCWVPSIKAIFAFLCDPTVTHGTLAASSWICKNSKDPVQVKVTLRGILFSFQNLTSSIYLNVLLHRLLLRKLCQHWRAKFMMPSIKHRRSCKGTREAHPKQSLRSCFSSQM